MYAAAATCNTPSWGRRALPPPAGRCELRFCITDCGPITCKAFRILDDVHHPNFVPRVGACRCHPEFLPSLYKGTFRPSLLLDEVWDRLQVSPISPPSATPPPPPTYPITPTPTPLR